MAVPTAFLFNTTGGAFTAQKQGGAMVGITDATTTTEGNPITKAIAVKDVIAESPANRGMNLPKLLSAGVYTTQKAVSGGAFAFTPAGKDRTSSDPQFVMMRVAVTLGGVSNTVLHSGAGDFNRRSIHSAQHLNGAKTLTKWAANQFSWVGVAGQRHNWISGVPATLATTNFWDLTDGDATDLVDANLPTLAVPGELVYLETGKTPTQDDYEAKTG
jgi:hypothetical protein